MLDIIKLSSFTFIHSQVVIVQRSSFLNPHVMHFCSNIGWCLTTVVNYWLFCWWSFNYWLALLMLGSIVIWLFFPLKWSVQLIKEKVYIHLLFSSFTFIHNCSFTGALHGINRIFKSFLTYHKTNIIKN